MSPSGPLVQRQAGGPLAAGPTAPVPAPPPVPSVAIWTVQQQPATMAPPPGITFNPSINVAVTAPAAPAAPPPASTVVVVGHQDNSGLAAVALGVLGMGTALGMTLLVVAAFVHADAEIALLFVLPVMWALLVLAFLNLARRPHR